jgi:hypothetical protein
MECEGGIESDLDVCQDCGFLRASHEDPDLSTGVCEEFKWKAEGP